MEAAAAEVASAPNSALDLQGQTAAAHIKKYSDYAEKALHSAEKARQHKRSAVCILVEVKDSIGHGQWLPWLAQHGINERTAQVWIAEHKNPEKAEERKATDRARKAEKPKASETRNSGGFETAEDLIKRDAPLKVDDPRCPLSTAPAPGLTGTMITHWEACLAAFRNATPSQQKEFKNQTRRHSNDILEFMYPSKGRR